MTLFDLRTNKSYCFTGVCRGSWPNLLLGPLCPLLFPQYMSWWDRCHATTIDQWRSNRFRLFRLRVCHSQCYILNGHSDTLTFDIRKCTPNISADLYTDICMSVTSKFERCLYKSRYSRTNSHSLLSYKFQNGHHIPHQVTKSCIYFVHFRCVFLDHQVNSHKHDKERSRRYGCQGKRNL